MKFYSQCRQDEYVYTTFFNEKKDGYFVDIGAHDGITFSNSKAFEELGWTGVCAEPNPKVFELLVNNRDTNKTKCVMKAISDTVGVAKFLRVNVYGPEMLSGLADDLDLKQRSRIKLETTGFDNPYDYIDVECDLFENIVDKTEIDFLSLDTEGNELKILKSIDFNKFDINIITCENNNYDNSIIDFLTKNGYEFLGRLEGDELYKKIK